MVKRFLVIVLILLLFGCESLGKRANPEPVKVEVPVIQECPVPPKVEKEPHLPIFDLTKEDKRNFNKIGEAYALSIKILQKKYEELWNILEGYRKHDVEK